MKKQASFADFFKFAPGLMALDRALDAQGCPVSYRKYLAVKWLDELEFQDRNIQEWVSRIRETGLGICTVFSTWYNNVYGHIVYEPPASRFVAFSTPVPVIVSWSPADIEVTLPNITLIQYELQGSMSLYLNSDGPLLTGLRKLQELPMARWVWLAMADYDISVFSFMLARPAYHLSLWHSLQVIEKLLKAVLITFGKTEEFFWQYSHNINKLQGALNENAFSLTSVHP